MSQEGGLPASDQQDLPQKLPLNNGLVAPAGGDWTIVPRIDLQQELTDNVLQQDHPRRFDLSTFIAPGIGVAADTSRLKVTFDFSPVLSIYAHTGSLNQLTEQMNGLASITLSPELAYVDLRTVSGVQSQYGGLGGLGALGVPFDEGLPTTPGSTSSLEGASPGLTRDNEVQTSSFSLSPYLVHRFGNWGSGRIGYSSAVTRSDNLSGFTAAPVLGGGSNGQSLFTNEETAHYESGEILTRLKDSFDVDLLQRQSRLYGTAPAPGSVAAPGLATNRSNRAFLTNTVSFALNRNIALFASGGHEDISYSTQSFASIHDLTWSIGTTLTPGPDSEITVSYGHQSGFNSLSIDGHCVVTARTTLTATYGTSLGTQLEAVQTQLDLASPGGFGNLVDARTGAPLFANINNLPVQDGILRTTNLALGSRTVLERDIITFNLLFSNQSSALTSNSSKLSAGTLSGSWVHQMQPDMTLNGGLSFSWQNPTNASNPNPGRNSSFVASLAWHYQISETLTGNVRYSLFSRQSEARTYSLLQNLIIIGLKKTF